MLAASPSSPLRDTKTRSSRAAPKRMQSRKDKVNVVSKASLAMLNPAYAMGIDVAPSWCDSPLLGNTADESYDSLREWGGAGPAAAGALARSVAKAGDGDLGGALEAWRSRPYWAQEQGAADASWQMSPTPELEAFTVEQLDVDALTATSASSSSTDLPMGEFASDYTLDAPHVAYNRSSFEHDDEDAPSAPAPKTRKNKGPRMGRRASEEEATAMPIAGAGSKGSNSSKSPHSSSLSRFFSWKRSTKHLGGASSRNGAAGIVVPPLPAFDGAFDEYAGMPMSAPPAVTTFEAALAGTGAPRHRYGIEESYPAQRLERGGRPSLAVESSCSQLGSSGSVSAPCTPVRAPQGLPSSSTQQPSQPPQQQTQQQQQPSVAQRASKFLGRKYSMPTLREVRRAQASAVGSSSHEASNAAWAASAAAQVGVLGSMPVESSATTATAAAVPTLPPLFGGAESGESMSPIIPSTSSSSGDGWGSAPRSRISSVGRGTARKGTESIYDGISSPRSPASSLRSPKFSTSSSGPSSETRARRGEFVVDEEHSLAYAGVVPALKAFASEPRALGTGGGSFAEKALRRRSRSMGSAAAPPPRLSRFGSPPTGFTPTSPYAPTFSPVLSSTTPLPVAGLGRGRGMATQQRGNGTPTQQSVAAFGASRGAAMTAAAAAAAAAAAGADEAQPRSSSEGETVQQARRVNLGGGRAGVRAVAVASPTLVARSPRLPQQALHAGRSRSPLRPRQENAPKKQQQQQAVVVNVMPPTPVLSADNDEAAAFEGDRPSLARSRETDGYGPSEEDDDEETEEEEEQEQAVPRRPRAPNANATSPRSAMSALRRDTVVIDAATWMPEAFDVTQQPLPYMPPASFGHDFDDAKLRERRPSLASSELSDMDESIASASSDGGDSPFGLARSLSSHSLASVASSSNGSDASSLPYGSPLRSSASMAASSISAASPSSQGSLGSSLGLRGMQFDSSSSLCSSTTTSTSILDFGMVASASSSACGTKGPLRQAFSYAPSSSMGADEPLGDDCETPRLSGGAAHCAVFASPIRTTTPLAAASSTLRSSPERIASPLLELDLSLPLDLDSLSNAVGLAALHSPKRNLRSSPGGAAGKARASPVKPPKSRARVEQQQQQQQMRSKPAVVAAPSTPPSTTARESVYDGASFDDAGLGLGLGLDFGAPAPAPPQEAPKQTQALRVVKRTQEPRAEHAALWGELGFAM